MKRLLLTGLIVFYACFTFAHSPGKIVLKPNLTNKTLTVTVHHVINGSETHYISTAEIYLNGQKIDQLTFKDQTSLKTHVFCERIDEMKEGDKIEVVCYCNISGFKKASAEVKNEQTKK